MSFFNIAGAQHFDMTVNRKRVNIPFKMIRNMVVVQLEINNKGPFNFILDTGVGIMLITDTALTDSLNLTSKYNIKLGGLGNGPDYEAYITSPLNVKMHGVASENVVAAILKRDHFGLSAYVGTPIHGLLGYEFFSKLAVKINFIDSSLTVSLPKNLKMFSKGTKIPLTIEQRKPYAWVKTKLPDGTETNSKVIVDLGGGHALLLESYLQNKELPDKFITANLGMGLTGPLNGYISRIPQLNIGHFKFQDIITSFPDSIKSQDYSVARDGNMGIQVLKRFTIIFDYANNAMYLKYNGRQKEPFEHDMTGIEYYARGETFDRIFISRVELGSSADIVGLETGDEIVSINLKPINKLTMDEIDHFFRSRDGRTLLLGIYRDNRLNMVVLTLRRRV
jgi:hypothetical protein